MANSVTQVNHFGLGSRLAHSKARLKKNEEVCGDIYVEKTMSKKEIVAM